MGSWYYSNIPFLPPLPCGTHILSKILITKWNKTPFKATFCDSEIHFRGIERGDISSEPIKSYRPHAAIGLTGYCVSLDWPANRLTRGTSHKRQLLFLPRHDIVIKGYDSLLIDSSWNGTVAGWLPHAQEGKRERPQNRRDRQTQGTKYWSSGFFPNYQLSVFNYKRGPAGNSRCSVLNIMKY